MKRLVLLFPIVFILQVATAQPVIPPAIHHKHYSLNTDKIRVQFVPNGDMGRIDTSYGDPSSASLRNYTWLLKDKSSDSNWVGLVEFGGLKLAGIDANGQEYRYDLKYWSKEKLYGQELVDGFAPLMPGIYEPIAQIDSQEFDRFNSYWKVSRQDVDQQKALWQQYNTGSFGWIPPQYIQGGILHWPSRGNPYTKDAYGDPFEYNMPFVNQDGNSDYIPNRGDYPKVPGEHNLLLLFNDVRNLPDTTLVNRIGLGGHVIAYTQQGGTDEEHTIFLEYTFKNHNTPLDTFIVSNALGLRFFPMSPMHFSEKYRSVSVLVNVDSLSTYGLSMVGLSSPTVTLPSGQQINYDFNYVRRYSSMLFVDRPPNPRSDFFLNKFADYDGGVALQSCDKRRVGGLGLGSGIFPFPKDASITFTLAISSIPLDNSKTCEEQIVELETHLSYLQDNYQKRGKRVETMEASNFLYPNPAKNFLYFSTPAEPGQLWLRSIDGRVIQQWNIEETTQSIGLPKGLAAGLYLVEYRTTNGKLIAQKIMVQ